MSQHKRILDYIEKKGGITCLEAMRDLGVGNLKARIHELRRGGVDIASVSETGKNRWGETTHYVRYKKCAAVSTSDNDTAQGKI